MQQKVFSTLCIVACALAQHEYDHEDIVSPARLAMEAAIEQELCESDSDFCEGLMPEGRDIYNPNTVKEESK